MRSCASSYFTRVACGLSVTTFLIFGSIGCDSGSGPATGTGGQLPPEAKKANESMENFAKQQEAKK
jgi:hypothetical protein